MRDETNFFSGGGGTSISQPFSNSITFQPTYLIHINRSDLNNSIYPCNIHVCSNEILFKELVVLCGLGLKILKGCQICPDYFSDIFLMRAYFQKHIKEYFSEPN